VKGARETWSENRKCSSKAFADIVVRFYDIDQVAELAQGLKEELGKLDVGDWRGREGLLIVRTAIVRRHVPTVKEGGFYPSGFTFGSHSFETVSLMLLDVDEGVFRALGDGQVMVRTAAVNFVAAILKRVRTKSDVEALAGRIVEALGEAKEASGIDGLLSALNVVLPYPPEGTLSRSLLDSVVTAVTLTLSSEASTVRQGGARVLGVLGWREGMVGEVGRKLVGLYGTPSTTAQSNPESVLPSPPPVDNSFSPSINRIKNDTRNLNTWCLKEGILMTFEVIFRGLLNSLIKNLAERGG